MAYSVRGIETLPVSGEWWWPRPTEEEIEAANEPRHYPPQEDALLTLTVPSIELYDAPVVAYGSEDDLDRGVTHLPKTPMPWEAKTQKNVYLAGHRLGRPDTTGRMIFFNLDKLKEGDSIALKDDSDATYEYQVSEIFVVEPDAEWVIDPVRDRDMLTLQTCTYPRLDDRIIVRAERV